MVFIWCIRGATAWEWQIGRVVIRILYPRFWRTSYPVDIWIADKDDEDG